LFTSSASGGNEVPPGSTATGWSIVSDSLPEVRDAQVRGAPQLDLATADLPKHVRQYVTELGKRSSVPVRVIAPWIPTRQTARGQSSPIDPRDILRRASASYAEPLYEMAAAEGVKGSERAAQILRRLDEAQAMLTRSDQAAARASLRQADRLLADTGSSDEWTRAVSDSLRLIIQHLIERIR
jgi:hypothetical protein